MDSKMPVWSLTLLFSGAALAADSTRLGVHVPEGNVIPPHELGLDSDIRARGAGPFVLSGDDFLRSICGGNNSVKTPAGYNPRRGLKIIKLLKTKHV